MEVGKTSATMACQIIKTPTGHFARYENALRLVGDNGSQFLPRDVERFSQQSTIEHAKSSTMYPRYKRKAETGVKE